MSQLPVPEAAGKKEIIVGRRSEGGFMQELGLELIPMVGRPTIEITIY